MVWNTGRVQFPLPALFFQTRRVVCGSTLRKNLLSKNPSYALFYVIHFCLASLYFQICRGKELISGRGRRVFFLSFKKIGVCKAISGTQKFSELECSVNEGFDE